MGTYDRALEQAFANAARFGAPYAVYTDQHCRHHCERGTGPKHCTRMVCYPDGHTDTMQPGEGLDSQEREARGWS